MAGCSDAPAKTNRFSTCIAFELVVRGSEVKKGVADFLARYEDHRSYFDEWFNHGLLQYSQLTDELHIRISAPKENYENFKRLFADRKGYREAIHKVHQMLIEIPYLPAEDMLNHYRYLFGYISKDLSNIVSLMPELASEYRCNRNVFELATHFLDENCRYRRNDTGYQNAYKIHNSINYDYDIESKYEAKNYDGEIEDIEKDDVLNCRGVITSQRIIAPHFKRPQLDMKHKSKLVTLADINLKLPMNELRAYIEKIKCDFEKDREIVKSPYELLGIETDSGGKAEKLNRKKVADMFFTYDYFKAEKPSGKTDDGIFTGIRYQLNGEQDERTIRRYRDKMIDLIDNLGYQSLI